MKKKIVILAMAIIAIVSIWTITRNFKAKESKNDEPDKTESSVSNETEKESSDDVPNVETENKTTTEVKIQDSKNENNDVKESNNNQNQQSNVVDNSNVVGKTKKGYNIEKKDGVYYIKGILVANKTYSLPSNYAPNGLLNEFTIAYNEMQKAAAKEGVKLSIVSGYRSYSTQNRLYNNYVKKDGQKEADTYSARPGHSEHQTGLAADLNKIDDNFGETKEGIWLANNCYKYGFILRYPKGKEPLTGYIYEPWHFRFIGDEAVNLYNNGNWISLEEYLGIDSKYQ